VNLLEFNRTKYTTDNNTGRWKWAI